MLDRLLIFRMDGPHKNPHGFNRLHRLLGETIHVYSLYIYYTTIL